MPFTPIDLNQYLDLFVKNNPGEDRDAAAERLRQALAAYHAGTRCSCGERIWVLGSAEVGYSCFTCITGEADPDNDYELAEACKKHDVC